MRGLSPRVPRTIAQPDTEDSLFRRSLRISVYQPHHGHLDGALSLAFKKEVKTLRRLRQTLEQKRGGDKAVGMAGRKDYYQSPAPLFKRIPDKGATARRDHGFAPRSPPKGDAPYRPRRCSASHPRIRSLPTREATPQNKKAPRGGALAKCDAAGITLPAACCRDCGGCSRAPQACGQSGSWLRRCGGSLED